MTLPKELITVTPLSKTIALIMFTLLPVIAFLLGMKFQQKMTLYVTPVQYEQVACTKDAKLCSDGSSVGRVGPNCEFAPCPAVDTPGKKEVFCGGIAGIACPSGYYCAYEGSYPDAGGRCVIDRGSDDGAEPLETL